jgi:hypothetical protein
MPQPPFATPTAVFLAALLVWASAASAAEPKPGPTLSIHRATGPIVIDGNLDDAGWVGADTVKTWYETRVGDNVEPQVRNLGFLAYDDHFLYAAFQFDDPHPELIRAPLGDHDQLSGLTDYGGVIVDSRNDGKTAIEFLANPNGLQYDAVQSDVSGEDSSPDFYWDSKGKITKQGYTLEIRIPFSSLRYANTPAPMMGILLYRNYPRDRHYQFFSAKLPRDVNCFVCNSNKMAGLEQLPHGSHLVVAPFGTTQQTAEPRSGPGSPLANDDVKSTSGVDVKWSPFTGLAIDGTVKPDFSQVESDAAQIVANERFALFFPEKRSFFLEGVDLFSTPFTAVYTRTVNQPDAGLRVTGRSGNTAFTALVAQDKGQGTVIIPGPFGSEPADQDFRSEVGVMRVRHDLGRSSVSVVATTREILAPGSHDRIGHNRVVGPDFVWQATTLDKFTGQALWSDSRTIDRPDLAAEWNGQTLQDRAYLLNWSHPTPTYDAFLQWQDLGTNFRADDGFIPQVGYREGYGQFGYTLRPKKAFWNRVRFFNEEYVDMLPNSGNDVLARHVQLGFGADGKLSSFSRLELNRDEFRVGNQLLQRFRPHLHFDASLGRIVNSVSADADVGEEIDFANARRARGTTLAVSTVVRVGDHLNVQPTGSVRWLNTNTGPGEFAHLFTAQVERLRTTYQFNARSFVRVIGQHVRTDRRLELYVPSARPSESRRQDFSFSGLFAYKINWQTVLYAGYGDQRSYESVSGDIQKAGRQLFAKVSYAWQQ